MDIFLANITFFKKKKVLYIEFPILTCSKHNVEQSESSIGQGFTESPEKENKQ